MSAAAAKGPQQSGRNPAALAQEYQSRRQELQSLAQKVGELEADADEHLLVIETLKETAKTQPDRKCYRLIGGVLVEKTVNDVLPALETGVKGLKQVIDTLMTQYRTKEQDLATFQKEQTG
ncbi:unnamed protein product [Sympodiomycopsis kandeliae]